MIKLLEIIKKASSILLTLHTSPDGDSVGANLAMYRFLKNLNKEVTLIAGDSQIPLNYKHLPGIENVLERNIFQIDLDEYDLFIALDIAGVDQISKLGSIEFPKNLTILNIDHHIRNQLFGTTNYIVADAPATCEIIYNLFKSWSASRRTKIDHDTAANLIVGIYDDSLFKYHNTTYKTFEIAAKLAKICPEFNDYLFDIDNSNSPEKIKFMGVALSHIENYFNDEVAISAVPFELMEKNRFPLGTTDDTDINNILKSVVGWNIGINFFEYQPDKIKLGFRTRDEKKYDVSLIAKELGGGGHKAASGATINMPFDVAKELLLKKLKSIYNL